MTEQIIELLKTVTDDAQLVVILWLVKDFMIKMLAILATVYILIKLLNTVLKGLQINAFTQRIMGEMGFDPSEWSLTTKVKEDIITRLRQLKEKDHD